MVIRRLSSRAPACKLVVSEIDQKDKSPFDGQVLSKYGVSWRALLLCNGSIVLDREDEGGIWEMWNEQTPDDGNEYD